jgi:L-serine/L-threonine ammonia-lyase
MTQSKEDFRNIMKSLHIPTTLWESRAFGAQVLFKMEALQPIGSFKIRGMGAACQASWTTGARRLVCASGGNAGYAVAYAGRKLGMAATIVVPKTTSTWMQDILRREGATVSVHGDSWDDAHAYATEFAKTENAAYIHPFDDPEVWEVMLPLSMRLEQLASNPAQSWFQLAAADYFADYWLACIN